MKTRFQTLAVVFLTVMTLIASACQPISPVKKDLSNAQPNSSAEQTENMDAYLPQTGEQAAAAPVEAPPGVGIVPFGSQTSALTNTAARIYGQPDNGSKVVAWANPGLHVGILGFSAGGDLIAVSSGETSDKLAGWISAADLIYQAAETHSLSITKVYRQPSSSSPVVSILTPDKMVGLLGTSPDKAWSAVVNGQMLLGWVQTTELEFGRPTVEMATLVKVHLAADENSGVTDILTPGVRYTALGRSQNGAWLAVASQDSSHFVGWVHASEIKTDASLMGLAVLSGR